MKKYFLALVLMLMLGNSCSVRYSFSGASIDPSIKTVSVGYFQNMAAMVVPILSPTFTDALTQKLQQQTRLQVVREDGDISFSGEIIDYRSDPVAISGDEYALKNRLTIGIKVTFVNPKQPQWAFVDKTFSDYEDYDSSKLLSSVEGTLIPQIVAKLVDKVFNEALANW